MSSNLFVTTSSFIAQLVLCVVFFKLGKDEEEEESERDSLVTPDEYPEIAVEAFDDHAEL